MKVVQEDEAVFRLEMEASDAQEAQIAQSVEDIRMMLKAIEEHGYSREIRIRDRAGYWRYANIEKSLAVIRDAASTALLHIKLLDFPTSDGPKDPNAIQ